MMTSTRHISRKALLLAPCRLKRLQPLATVPCYRFAFVAFAVASALCIPSLGLGSTLWVNNATSTVYEFDGTSGAPEGSFTAPGPIVGLAQYSGNTYLLNDSNGSVYEYNSSGQFVSTFITGAQSLYDATAITFGQNGDLYMSLGNSNEVVYYSPSGSYLGVFANGPTNKALDSLDGLAFDHSGNLYVADFFGQQLVTYGPKGGNPSSMSPVAGQISSIAFNSTGTSYDYSLFSTGGVYSENGTELSSCSFPSASRGLALESDGNLYFACQDNGTVDRVNATTGGTAQVFASGGGLTNALDLAFLPYTVVPTPEVSTAQLGCIGFATLGVIAFLRKRKVV